METTSCLIADNKVVLINYSYNLVRLIAYSEWFTVNYRLHLYICLQDLTFTVSSNCICFIVLLFGKFLKLMNQIDW